MSYGEEDTDELLRQFVYDALISKSTGGSSKLYDQLISELRRLKLAQSSDSTAPQQLSALLHATIRCIASIQERKHEVLITELLDIPLWHSSQVARAAILDFISHAVVANGALVQSCLHTLVYALLPPPGPAVSDENAGEEWHPIPEHAAIQDDVVRTVIKVLELVPTSAQRLLPLLVSNFPHKLRDRQTHCLYLRALFSLAESSSGAGVREGILASVIDHLISVDVEIKWEDIVEVVTEEAKEEVGGIGPGEEEPDIFELEGMSELELATGMHASTQLNNGESAMPGGGWEGGHALEGPLAAPGLNENGDHVATAVAVDETADKLDSMMEMTMEHLSKRVASGQLPATWDTSILAFERTILHTHRSKFVQFLLFFLARYAPEQCCGSFVGLLLARITDRLQPPITRSAAAAYAGSFLARAGFVPEPLVVEALQRLTDWCVKYTREEDRRGGLPPIPSSVMLSSLASTEGKDRHAAFYAAFQSLVYALCYHMEPLLKQKSRSNHHSNSDVLAACAAGIQKLFVEAMPRLLTHPLDPLSSCARSVVLEFGRQAGSLGHPELLNIVKEWEKRQRAGLQNKSSRPLEVFFPFDPYLLRRSSRYLELPKSYVVWRKGHPTGAPRSGLDTGEAEGHENDHDEMLGSSDGEGGDMTSSDDSSSDDSDLESDSSSDEDFSSSGSDTDDLRRSRFGSMPDSSLSSGGRGGKSGLRRFQQKRHRLPGALKASLVSGNGSSPTSGMPIPNIPGSLSTDGSPWGMSPAGGGYYGSSFAPMSLGK